jgi:chromosome segregation ATPase
MNGSYLLVNLVIIKGIDQQYACSFEEGLNIVWGDMDSGKSTILNLIDFCLGGKGDDLDYDELQNKGRIAFLEVDLNGRVTTFERVLHHADSIVKVYDSSYENIETVYPKLCSPISTVEQPDGWVSDLILEKLGIPRVKIKESKIRNNANSYRLSFRDLMKLLYLHQKKVASENLMDSANPAVLNKNIEIQKFVYGVHDDQLSELNIELKSNSKLLSELQIKSGNVREFLKATYSLNTNQTDLSNLRENIESIDFEIEKLTVEEETAGLISSEFKKQLRELDSYLNTKRAKLDQNKKKLNDFIRLKATYQLDLQCLNASNTVKKNGMGSNDIHSFDCPLCDSTLSINCDVLTESDIQTEQKSLKNRIQGCRNTIESLMVEQDELSQEINELEDTVVKIRGTFDKENIASISPLVETINTLHNSKKIVFSKLAALEKNVKLKNKLDETDNEIAAKESMISKIKLSINDIEKSLKDINLIIKGLSGEFRLLMVNSKLSNNYSSEIDKRFMPVFRNRSYDKISSGGVRTIMSVNLYLSRLRYLFKNGGNLPTFLMMDTPGQNIGRYARAIDSEENLSDPAIYEEIYKQILKIDELGIKLNKRYQIIVVDNDLANCLEEGSYKLVKRFDKTDSKYEKGLIFDA